MNFNDYQKQARETAIYPNLGANLVYPALKLSGEAGEVAEKIGKLMRDKGYEIGKHWGLTDCLPGQSFSQMDAIEEDLAKELGDVLWYVSALASELGLSLDLIARINLDKLNSRMERGKLQGSGDNR